MSPLRIETGSFHPLGATWDGRGTNFALFSQHATAVELCLFDEGGRETRVPVPWRSLHVWHVYVPGARPGQRYGFRVHGPFAPREGHRFNPNKLLVDPYARALEGRLDADAPIYAYPRDSPLGDLGFDDRDDAAGKPKGLVVDPAFDWGDDRPPRVPWRETVLYEAHVKGFTMRHPAVPPEHRGTFLGLASEAGLAHLESLGVTTVELMPVHERVDEPALTARGRTNYWGYNTLSYFAPDRRFATPEGSAMREFKWMVKRLHARGIEVVIDVVYNHTCEGGAGGPTISFRGIDNSIYYRLDPRDRRQYVDYSGCGNTLDAAHPQVLKLITDSLRYWVSEMHVDGFRFDLAPTLARGNDGDIDRVGAFFAVVHQDPVLSQAKLIAEPWDLGAGGYQVGDFPILWTEWNGRFRDTVRRFWRGERRVIGDLGYRLTGSSDLFGDDGRGPHASINFVTAHDGFTLRDLVTYEKKHNEANGEDNRDGLDDNASQSCGVEGETGNQRVIARRRSAARSILATLLLSQGVPMIEMGDELWRTQRGNNNPYCHDSDLTWVDWRLDDEGRAMLDVARALAAFRKRHAVFRRRDFLRGERIGQSAFKDITWLRPDGVEMTPEDWTEPEEAALAFRLDGSAFSAAHEDGEAVADASFVVLMNGERAVTPFLLSATAPGEVWRVVVDTRERPRVGEVYRPGERVDLDAGALLVLTSAVESAVT
ncbi:MAG: glycogen debranching protein GlgX [Polyangiaceae bacterium]|nr:glycogen debranching protein GlgX [Polyangiaceae bacterium]